MESRPKILVESYECSPARGHAPGAAWKLVTRLARWFDLWVLCEETQYAREILDYRRAHPDWLPGLRFHFISRRDANVPCRKRPPLPVREIRNYSRWLRDAYAAACRLHDEIGFDLAHHLRSNTFRRPGNLWQLRIPFVWGPVGGTYRIPAGLLAELDPFSRLHYQARNLVGTLQLYGSPSVRGAARRAAGILTQTTGDRDTFRRRYGRTSVLLHEQAADPGRGFVHAFAGRRELNVAWVGRCIAGKALPLLLKALRPLRRARRIRLHIVGDGPRLEAWRQLARALGVDPLCTWYGWVESARAAEILERCDLLAFTSLLEGTSATVMEALSLGVPVLCLRHCGMGDVVTDACGFPIPIDPAPSIVPRMAHALKGILREPDQLARKSRAALAAARDHTWDRAAEVIRDEYLRCLGLSHISIEPRPEPLCLREAGV